MNIFVTISDRCVNTVRKYVKLFDKSKKVIIKRPFRINDSVLNIYTTLNLDQMEALRTLGVFTRVFWVRPR